MERYGLKGLRLMVLRGCSSAPVYPVVLFCIRVMTVKSLHHERFLGGMAGPEGERGPERSQ